MDYPVIAASTQRQIGYVIAAIVLLAMAIYWLFNWLEGRHETGAEIELAANRKPHMSDEEMETKRLDLSLTGGLVTLTIIALALPLYWLGEPGRQNGLVEFTDDQAVRKGANVYEENCAQCHGSANGDGGAALDFSLVDSNGVFVEQVDWTAPSLAAVLDRFSYDEVKYILNWGRPNSPMPAWGGPGGGSLTDLQIDWVIQYLAAEQQDPDDIAKSVLSGLDQAALFKAHQDNPEMYAELLRVEALLHDLEEDRDYFSTDAFRASAAELGKKYVTFGAAMNDLTALQASHTALFSTMAQELRNEANVNEVLMGELLFNNPAAGGAYGCARCHSAGYSYNANDYPFNPLIDPIENGGGGLGPSLIGVVDQFETATGQVDFITTGSKNGQAYGAFGMGDGGGGMPGFGACWAEDNQILPRIQTDRITGHCDGTSETALNAHDGEIIARDGILSEEQIMAIVAYERSLES